MAGDELATLLILDESFLRFLVFLALRQLALGGEAINANYRINLDVIGSVSLCQEYFY